VTDAYPGSTNNNNDVRSVVTTDGTSFYMTGTSFPTTGANATNSGTHYATLGATTSFRLGNNLNTRNAVIYNNKLYVSSGSGAFVGINQITDPSNPTALPVPTTNSAFDTTNIISTGASSTVSSPYDFWFKDDNTVYIADDRSTTSTPNPGGIQKWTFDGSTWSLAYVLTTNLGTGGVRGLDGAIVGGNAQLWATTAPSSTDGTLQNAVVTVVDTGATSAYSTVFAAATNTTVRGVVHVASVGLAGDYNSDGKVDAQDYVIWRKTNINGAQGYTDWRANYGTGGPGAGSGLDGGSVPEPTSGVLFLLGLAVMGLRRRQA